MLHDASPEAAPRAEEENPLDRQPLASVVLPPAGGEFVRLVCDAQLTTLWRSKVLQAMWTPWLEGLAVYVELTADPLDDPHGIIAPHAALRSLIDLQGQQRPGESAEDFPRRLNQELALAIDAFYGAVPNATARLPVTSVTCAANTSGVLPARLLGGAFGGGALGSRPRAGASRRSWPPACFSTPRAMAPSMRCRRWTGITSTGSSCAQAPGLSGSSPGSRRCRPKCFTPTWCLSRATTPRHGATVGATPCRCQSPLARAPSTLTRCSSQCMTPCARPASNLRCAARCSQRRSTRTT